MGSFAEGGRLGPEPKSGTEEQEVGLGRGPSHAQELMLRERLALCGSQSSGESSVLGKSSQEASVRGWCLVAGRRRSPGTLVRTEGGVGSLPPASAHTAVQALPGGLRDGAGRHAGTCTE